MQKKSGQRERSPEEVLDIETAEAFARLRGRDGKVPSAACYRVAEGLNHPTRILARRVREAKAKRVDPEDVKRAILEPLERYIDEKYGITRDEPSERRA